MSLEEVKKRISVFMAVLYKESSLDAAALDQLKKGYQYSEKSKTYKVFYIIGGLKIARRLIFKEFLQILKSLK